MRRASRFGLLTAAALLSPACFASVTSVSPGEVQTWIRYVVPLPKQIQITGKASVECSKVSIVLPESPDIKVPQARKEIRETLGLSASGSNPANPDFTITLQLGGAEASGLSSLPNSEQAYRILPEAGGSGLRLVALDPYGLYYAAKTLQLMLAPKVSAGRAEVPILEVLDWPDMADRGLWGCDHFVWLKWMGDRKMNIGEQISDRSVTPDKVGHSGLKSGREPMVTEGPYYGVKPVPAQLHLEQVYGTGLFQYVPEVIGVGGQYGCICYSNGTFTRILADWLCDLASLPYVEGVDVWMAENLHGQGGCQCAQCKQWDRNVLEAKIIVEAWEQAKARLGRYFKLWILTSEETYGSHNEIFASIPADVRVWYYHSLYTYTSGRTSIIPNNVASLASSGRYAGVCPSLSNIGCTQPFQSAEFVRYRMNDFVDKKLRGFIGYATPPPLVKFCGYNVEAAAEWSWNAKGRSAHEFAVSYAVRKGISNPERFGEWADAIGKVEFDLYGSEWPSCEGKFFPGYVADLLKRGTLPSLGTANPGARGPWGEFKTAQQLDDDMILAAKALNLAKQMGIKEYYYESLYADGLVTSLKALYKLKGLVIGGTVSPDKREIARYWFGIYINSIKQAIDAIQEWARAVDGSPSWSANAVAKLRSCIYGETGTNNPGMLQVAIDCGCNPDLPYSREPATTIAEAKRRVEGEMVKLYGDIVTGGHTDRCFLQTGDRACAIQIRTTSNVAPNSAAGVVGVLENVDGELVVNADVVQSAGQVEPVKPLVVSTRDIAGGAFGSQPAVMEYRMVKENGKWVRKLLPAAGLNNLGLFVRVSGYVTFVGPGYFYVDDGGGCDDDSGHRGVRVICADKTWPKPAAGEYVRIDGMCTSYRERERTWRALYLPSITNLTVIPLPLEIIIDEDGASLTGQWQLGTSNPGAAYEDDFAYTASAAVENASARWIPNIPRPGVYEVYVMYRSGPDRTWAAPYKVVFDGGTQSLTLDQSSAGGQWHLIGSWPFAAGKAGYVELSNATPDPQMVVVADAVRFVRVSGGTPPTVTAQPNGAAVCVGESATFTVAASGSSPLAYQWRRGTQALVDDSRYSGTTSPTLTISNCQPGDAASNYNVLITNDFGSVPSNDVALLVGNPQAGPAAAPASGIGADYITWNWGAASGAVGYRIWTAAGGGSQVGGTIAGTSYTESGLEPGSAYTRYVEAVYGCGTSVARTPLGPETTAPRYCVENGDFESGFTGGIGNRWIKMPDDGTSTYAQETVIKRDGTSSQRLKDPVGGQAFTGWLYQKVNVQPNRGYTYRVWNRREVTGGCVVLLGVNPNGGLSADLTWQTMGSGGGIWSLKSGNFTSGSTGLVTLMFCAGQNKSDTTAYIDGVYLQPQAPTSSSGTTAISLGQSVTITAGGGFGGSDSELHWYTAPGGTGAHIGTGTSLTVSPTVTTTYYPRWESAVCSGSCCASDDGPAVTVTVN